MLSKNNATAGDAPGEATGEDTGTPARGAAEWIWRERPLPVRVAAVVLLVAAAAFLSRILAAPIGGSVFLLYFPAVAAAGFLLGPMPALLAIVLSAMSVQAFAPAAGWNPLPTSALEAQRLLLFGVAGGAVAALGALLRADRLQAATREAVLRRRTWALGERVKEQRCLYSVSSLLARTDLGVEDVLRRAVVEIPAGWRWPERTGVRIQVDGGTYRAGRFDGATITERRRIQGSGGGEGFIEVGVQPDREGKASFLEEEHRLLDALADRVGEMLRRREAEARLERSEAHFRSLVENISEVIVILDETGVNRYVSPSIEPALGYRPEERVGRSTLELIHPEDRENVRAHLLSGVGETVHFRIRHADGRWRQMEAVGTNMTADPAVAGIMVVARDITERRELEERLQSAQRMEAIGRLAGGVAHDFNNILTGIQGLTHLTLDELPHDTPDEVRGYLKELDHATSRAADLTRQLLAFSRQQVLQPRVVDLSGTVRALGALLDRLLGGAVELRTELADDGTLVRVDPGQLEQVLLNLAVNARDAMVSGGELMVRTGSVHISPEAAAAYDYHVEPGRYALLTVVDTGQGMDEEVQRHIFEPFFTTKPQGKGTGLGLSTVYGIVKQSGGYIWVDSAPGRGTTVRVVLPRVEGTAAEPKAASPPARKGAETILLAEDDDAVRALGRRILGRWGYTVLEAANGQEALERLGGSQVDLLITDLIMPHMGGRELVERVRRSHPGLPVLVMSGYADDRELRAELERSGDVFLGKPFTPDALARAVRDALDRRAAR
ncbi:MAG: ATP-binding protein, partial [Gemmatimonadota bacterium]